MSFSDNFLLFPVENSPASLVEDDLRWILDGVPCLNAPEPSSYSMFEENLALPEDPFAPAEFLEENIKRTYSVSTNDDLSEEKLFSESLSHCDLESGASTKEEFKESQPESLQELQPTGMSKKFANFDTYLLKMIDTESCDFILKGNIDLTEELKQFLACNIEVLTKVSLETQSGESTSDWIQRANISLKKVIKKRNDQKLRKMFSNIVKMMLFQNDFNKTAHLGHVKSTRHEHFIKSFGGKQPEKFEEFIKGCKFPSIKKLKAELHSFPEFTKNLKELLNSGEFLKSFLPKRTEKAQKVLETYLLGSLKDKNCSSVVVAEIKRSFKSYPWSMRDIEDILGLLKSISSEATL